MNKEELEELRTKTEVFCRVCGYFSEIHCWNAGKKEEFKLRKNYKL